MNVFSSRWCFSTVILTTISLIVGVGLMGCDQNKETKATRLTKIDATRETPPKAAADMVSSNMEANSDAELLSEANSTAALNEVDSTSESSEELASLDAEISGQDDTQETPTFSVDDEHSEDTETTYRLWIPTRHGPLLVGLDILIDGTPLRTSFDERLALVKSKMETPLRWDTLIESVSKDPGTFGERSAQTGSQKRNLIKTHDRNNNGVVENQEMNRFLFRNSGFYTEFRMFGSDDSNRTIRSKSPLFKSPLFNALDQDDSRVIDASELEHAEASLLRRLDRNLDQRIDLNEWDDSTRAMGQSPRSMRSKRDGQTVMDLSGYLNWTNLSYAMGGMKDFGPLLTRSNPVADLDADDDDWISEPEAKSILTLPTHFDLQVDFQLSDPNPSDTIVTLSESVASQVDVTYTDQRGTWVSGGPLKIGFIIDRQQRPERSFPEQAFDQLDANNDGALEPSEIPPAAKPQIPFESLDVDKNGKLTFQEVTRTPDRKPSLWDVQIQARAVEHPDALFAWLDSNHDQLLSTREIRSASAVLRTVNGGTTELTPADLPETILIRFSRGEPAAENTRAIDAQSIFAMTAQDNTDRRQNWAIQMDRNQDHDISEQEFIGPVDVFRQLDRNGDRFLDAAEVAQGGKN